ncbi:DUF1990 family protein [Rhodococcus sp. ENV425]|uniref:DUF1990 family protein n=1 Tax=Rhodococcus sp. ENV425 TaxID=2042960 RepID=UPI000C99E2AE|nr:DUF1990 domain-containing protein [Rhodococcus sp. ENV425]PND49421.1 DUF1990 domain-containing protein [Rhodococcus sp. ENV425]
MNAQRSFNYPHVGATRGRVPAGFRHAHLTRRLGSGDVAFRTAVRALESWNMQRHAGFRVDANTPRPRAGLEVRLDPRFGPARWGAWCRVVYVVDEPDRRGFAYGTLDGHPVSGEEAFVVERRPDGAVFGHISAVSRPGRWFPRLGAPVLPLAQRWMMGRYLDALAGR